MDLDLRVTYSVLMYILNDDGADDLAIISKDNLPSRLRSHSYQEILQACQDLASKNCFSCSVGWDQTIKLEHIHDLACNHLLQEVYSKLQNSN